jgi:hypothetical protein
MPGSIRPLDGTPADDAAPLAAPAAGNGGASLALPFAEMAAVMGTEVLRFASRRLQAQADHISTLANCRSLEEVMARQVEFLNRAGSEWSEELGAVLKLSYQRAEQDRAQN